MTKYYSIIGTSACLIDKRTAGEEPPEGHIEMPSAYPTTGLWISNNSGQWVLDEKSTYNQAAIVRQGVLDATDWYFMRHDNELSMPEHKTTLSPEQIMKVIVFRRDMRDMKKSLNPIYPKAPSFIAESLKDYPEVL